MDASNIEILEYMIVQVYSYLYIIVHLGHSYLANIIEIKWFDSRLRSAVFFSRSVKGSWPSCLYLLGLIDIGLHMSCQNQSCTV